MGTAKVCFPTLPKMIDFLKTIEPGLTYTHFYIRGNRPTPSPALCFDIVRTMQWLNQQGNPILLTPNGAISLVNQKAPAPAVLAGMRDIWFVSDEQLRAQEILDQDKVDRRDYSAGAASGQRASQNPAVMPPPGGITRFRQYPLAPNSR
jgi:hypothetical protein